jgi:hypothetical protein
MKSISVWHAALKEEIGDIIESELGTPVQTDNEYGDDDGNIYFPLSNKELIEQKPKFESVTGTARNEIGFLRNILDNEVKTIRFDQDQGFDLESFLSNLHSLPEVYGVLLRDDRRSDYMINPLHPLTALAIKLGQVKLPKKGSIILYNWSEESILSIYNIKHSIMYDNDIEATWMKFINQSKNFIGKKISERKLTIDKEEYLNQLHSFDSFKQLQLFGDINYEEVNEVTDIKALLIPLQVAIDSIATPYYGVSYIDNPLTSPCGFNSGFMISGNLKHSFDTSTGDVCTGSSSNTRDTGWLTLNRVNLDSMWYRNIITPHISDLIKFVYTSKYIASQFYKISDKKSEEEDSDLSVEERIAAGRD